MMRIDLSKLACAAAALSLAALNAAAASQEYPKAELFGGYQYTRIGGVDGTNINGWNGAINGNVNRWFGVTADLSGAYKDFGPIGARAYTYTLGPTFSHRSGRVTAFAHVLAGGFYASAGFRSLSLGTSGLAMMTGGGVDARVTPHLAVRALQADWLLWRTMGFTERKNARISTGLVFLF